MKVTITRACVRRADGTEENLAASVKPMLGGVEIDWRGAPPLADGNTLCFSYEIAGEAIEWPSQ